MEFQLHIFLQETTRFVGRAASVIVAVAMLTLSACARPSPRSGGLMACLDNPSSIAVNAAGEGWIVGGGFNGNGSGIDTRQHCTDTLHLGNNTWTQVSMPTDVNFDAVSMVTPTDVWASSDKGMYHYDGTHWSAVAVPILNATAVIPSIAMDSATDGWAIVSSSPTQPLIHYTNGAWEEGNALALGTAPTDYLSQVTMLSATDGWAVGSHDIAHYDGIHWSLLDNAITQRMDLNLTSVAFASPDEGWAVGIVHTPGTPVAMGGIILHYTQGTWTVAATPSALLSSVVMVSPKEAWTGGVATAGGTSVWHLVNGQWTSVSIPNDDGIVGMAMQSPTAGWAISDNAIYQYHDGVWTAWHVRGPSEH